jgi:cytochrome c oxidase subunit IV
MSDIKETIHEHDDHVVPPVTSTLTTFVVLALLAVLALGVGFSNLGPWKVFASLAVTGVQAFVLAVFFMDLRQADKLTWLCAGASVFWVLIMFTFTLTDYITRHMAAY